MLLYMVFRSVTEALVLIFPTLYAMTGGLLLQWYLGYNFSVAVRVGYIALFGIAVETGVVMIVYLHEALDRKRAAGSALQHSDIEQAAIEGAVQRLRPKLMTVAAVLASLVPKGPRAAAVEALDSRRRCVRTAFREALSSREQADPEES
jgi:Cu(I)/Ag(I) efflux system membrane protein CusA/SilA